MCPDALCEDVQSAGGVCMEVHVYIEMHVWRCMCTDAPCEDVQSAGDACMEVHVYICRCMNKGACVKKHYVKTYIQCAGDVCMEVYVY